jgi:hypothetical protein
LLTLLDQETYHPPLYGFCAESNIGFRFHQSFYIAQSEALLTEEYKREIKDKYKECLQKRSYLFPIGILDYKHVHPAAGMESRYLPHQSASLLIG